MTCKIKRRSLRCGGRPKADFGSLFTSVIAPTLNAAGSIADESIAKHNTLTAGTVNNNTVIPSDPTKTPTMRLGGRKKCWIGAAIGAATSIAGSLFGNSAQKREMRRQKSIQDWQNTTQEAAAMSNALNNSQDYQEDYLRQFRTAARLGKTLGAKGIYITDGGDATKIGNNTYLLRGGSHEDVNETGQTGIGINVGGNEIEAEGGEVAQKKNGALRIFSAQPILGGISPAQAVMRGANKDKVFNAQQRFKSRHHLSDDGETYKNGGVKGPTYNKQTRRWYNAQGKMLRVGHGYYSQNSNRFVQYNTDGTVSRFSPLNWRDKEIQGEKHTQSMRVRNKSIALKPAFTIGKGAMYSPIRVHKVQLKNNKNRGYTIDSEDITNDAINVVGGGEKLFGKKFKVQSLNTKFAIPYGKGITINGREVSKNLLDSIAYNAGLNKYPIDKLTYAYGLPSQESHNGRIASGNIVNKNKSYNTKEYNNAIANMNVFKNFGVIPANVVVRNWSNKNDAATDKKNAYNLSTNLSPLYQSFDLFRRGLYNTGDKNHTNDVKTAGDLIINSPEFKTYWETSGKQQYTRGYNDTNKASSYDRMINSNKEYSRYINHYPNKRLFKLGGRCKLRNGGYYGANYPSPLSLLSVLYNETLGRFDNKNPFLQTGIAPTPSRALNLKQVRGGLVNKSMFPTNRVYRIANMREVKDAKAIGQYRKLPEGVTLPTKTVRTRSGRTFEFGKAGGNSHGGKAAAMGEPWTGTTSGGYNESKYIISTPSRHTTWSVGHGGNYSKPLPADAIKKGSGIWKKFDAEGNTGISTKRMVVYKELGNGKYLRLAKGKYKLGGLTSKDRGSSKHPYPSVSSKDFAGGGRSYPIPTKADAVDALRLAGLHGRSDVRSKVFNKYPSLRKKSLLGSSNRPVKGMRPKAGTGMYVPFNKRYTSIYDAPDYDSDYNGGNVLGNGEVTVTAKRIKPTFMKPNNDAMNLIKVPKEEVPYIHQKHNRSRTIFSGGDYLGLGIDTLAALSTGLVNYNTAGKYTLPDRAPIIQANKLPTTYNVNPEIEEVKRYRDRLTGQTFNNTSSSVAALNRSGAINLDALSNLSKLWATKENEENKMLTEDAKNQQTVAAQNVQNELARQSEIARIKNEATQAKGEALNVGLSGLSQAWTNFWTAGRIAYEDDQSRRAMIASSKEATPTRLSEMDFDLSPDSLASLYRTAKDDRTRRFYLSRLSPKQRQKYGIN